jgi:xylulokinase
VKRQNDDLIIGLDIGTTNVKACAYTAGGQLAAQSSQGYPTYYPHQGWAEQDPLDWQNAAFQCLRELIATIDPAPGCIAGIGVSAHSPAFIPVDHKGDLLLKRVPIWQDGRSHPQGKALLEEIGPSWIGLGMPMAAFAAKLRWYADTYPRQVELTRYALGVKSYLVQWLTNEVATDPSSEPGIDRKAEPVWKACGWSPEQSAPVYPATAIVGELRRDLASDLNLDHSIPVVVGLNDGASATLANGALTAGEAVITLGTNGVIFLVSEESIPPADRLEKALFCWPYLDNRWIVGGQTKSGASSLDWVTSILFGSADPSNIDMLLEEASQSPAGSGGVFFFPYLMGSGTPNDDPSATGSALGLTLSRSRGDLARAVLEGVAFTLRDVQEELGRQGQAMQKVWITGGGARSELWRDITAMVLNRTLHYANADSALGAAMLASVGVGVHADIEEARRAMSPGVTRCEPDPQGAQIYDTMYRNFSHKRDLLLKLSSEAD